MINEFYAITETSVYFVEAKGEHDQPMATKIALKGESYAKVGCAIRGPMIAICDRLIAYIPEGEDETSSRRKIENVKKFYWGRSTSKIVALFLLRKNAMACFNEHDNFVPCDPRWHSETKEVIATIGENHPQFEVCKAQDLSLFK